VYIHRESAQLPLLIGLGSHTRMLWGCGRQCVSSSPSSCGGGGWLGLPSCLLLVELPPNAQFVESLCVDGETFLDVRLYLGARQKDFPIGST